MGIFDSLLNRNLIGLDIGVSSVKAVEIHGKKTPKLACYNRVPLPKGSISPEGGIMKPEAIVMALKSLFKNTHFSGIKVAIGIAGNSVITKKITVPKMDRTELEHQLFWEAEQYIPFDVEDVNLDFAILGQNMGSDASEPMMDVLLVAAKKDYISNIMALVDEANLVPEVIDIQAFALGNVFEFTYGAKSNNANNNGNVIIDFGAGSTKVSIVEGDRTTFTRESRVSGNGCTERIMEVTGKKWEEAEAIKTSGKWDSSIQDIVANYVQLWVEEVSRTLDFAVSQSPEISFQAFYICGGASKTKGLEGALSEALPAKVRKLNPIENIMGSGRPMNARAVEELSYLGSVAVGLSLRTVGEKK